MEGVEEIIKGFQNTDDLISSSLEKAQVIVSSLDDSSVSLQSKYESALSTEYLLYKLRVVVEREAVAVKRILYLVDNANIKAMFLKRDTYLTSISSKITTFVNDLNVLQRFHYSSKFKS